MRYFYALTIVLLSKQIINVIIVVLYSPYGKPIYPSEYVISLPLHNRLLCF